MSSANRKRIVLNSHRFFRDISPEILKELGLEDDSPATLVEGDPELYSIIRQGNHQIIITAKIRQEYVREARKEGFPAALIGPVINQLTDHGLVIEPRNLPGGTTEFPGIPKAHSVFPVTAILSKADYLVTEYRMWHSRADTIAQHGPTVISPDEFIQREGR